MPKKKKRGCQRGREKTAEKLEPTVSVEKVAEVTWDEAEATKKSEAGSKDDEGSEVVKDKEVVFIEGKGVESSAQIQEKALAPEKERVEAVEEEETEVLEEESETPEEEVVKVCEGINSNTIKKEKAKGGEKKKVEATKEETWGNCTEIKDKNEKAIVLVNFVRDSEVEAIISDVSLSNIRSRTRCSVKCSDTNVPTLYYKKVGHVYNVIF